MTRRWPARRTILLAVMPSVLFLAGCSLARSAGGEFASGAVARVSESDSSVVALQRALVDSGGAFLREEFSSAVLIPARNTWAEMRKGVRDEGDSLAVRLDDMLRLALTETLPAGLDSSAASIQGRFAGLGRAFADEFTLALGEGVATSIQPAADSLIVSLMSAAVRGIDMQLEPAIHAVMLGLRDSLEVRIGDVDRAVAGSDTVSGVRAALMGAGAVVLLAGLVSAIGGWRRKGRALDALIEAIQRGGDEGTRRAVETCAKDAGIHSWLSDRIGHRLGAPAPRRDASAQKGARR